MLDYILLGLSFILWIIEVFLLNLLTSNVDDLKDSLSDLKDSLDEIDESLIRIGNFVHEKEC